jgi:hypothetical protein
MAVIPILSLKGGEARACVKAAAQGDLEAQRELTELFTGEGWDNIGEFECFFVWQGATDTTDTSDNAIA